MSTAEKPMSTEMAPVQLAPITSGIELPEGVVLTATGLILPNGLPKDDFISAFTKMAQANKVFGIAMADLIVHGEDNFAQLVKGLMEQNGIEEGTVRRHCWIARKIPAVRRRTDVLSLTHHEAVAALSPEKQDMYLALAFSEKLSSAQLRQRIEQDGAKKARPKIVDAAPINGVSLKTGKASEDDTDPWKDAPEQPVALAPSAQKAPTPTPAPPVVETPAPVAKTLVVAEPVEISGAVLIPKEIDLLAPITWSATVGNNTVTMTEQVGAGGRLEHILTLNGQPVTPNPTNPMAARSRAEAMLRQQ